MPYVFSAAVDGANFHVRVTPNLIQHSPLIDERPHKHFFVEFHYVFNGEETLFFPKEEKRLSLSKGMIVMIPRGIYHCAETKGNLAVSRLCFNFSMDPEEERENPVLPIFLSAREPLILCDPTIENAMERLRKILENESDPMGDTREGILLLDVILSIFGRLSAKGKTPPKKQSQTKLRQKWLIEEHIFTRYHDPDGLEGLAGKLYLSQRQTRKLVKHFYGEDYKTLIVRQRMEMAQLLLESPTLSLEEASEKVGYRSYSGFHLAFVRSFGITPGEYRKEKRKP